MSDDNYASRLSVAEEKLKQHERMHDETQASIRSIAEGVARLVESEGRRSQYEETFKRLFGMHKEISVKLEAFIEKQNDRELAAYRGIVWKIIGLTGLVIAAVVAGHFGGKLP